MLFAEPLSAWITAYLGPHSFLHKYYFNAYKPAQLLAKLLEERLIPIPESVLKLKQGQSPSVRLYNWNIVQEGLKKLQFQLSTEQKSNILAQNENALKQFLERLMNKFAKIKINEDLSPQKVQPDQKYKPKTKPSQFQTHIIDLLITEMGVSQQQAKALLSEGNKYIAHLLVKGLKGQFASIIKFMKALKSQLRRLIELDLSDDKILIVQFVKPALLSKSFELSQLTFTIVQFIMQLQSSISEQWLCNQPVSLLGTVFLSLKRHENLQESVKKFFKKRSKQSYKGFLRALSKVAQTHSQQIQFIKRFKDALSANLSEGDRAEVFQMFVQRCRADCQMSDIDWLIDMGLQLRLQLNIIQRFYRESSQESKQKILVRMFEILGTAIKTKNIVSADIYRSIVRLFQHSLQSNSIRKDICKRIYDFLSSNSSMPPQPICLTLAKRLHSFADSDNLLQEINLLKLCLNHPRLKQQGVFQILDSIFTLFVNSKNHRMQAMQTIQNYIPGKSKSGTMQEFMVKILKICLAIILNLSTKKSKKAYVLQMILIFIDHFQQTNKIILLITHAHHEVVRSTGRPYKGFLDLLSRFGNPDQLLQTHSNQQPAIPVKQRSKSVKKIQQNRKVQTPHLPAIQGSPRNQKHSSLYQKNEQISRSSILMKIQPGKPDLRILNHLKKMKLESEIKQLNEQEKRDQEVKHNLIIKEKVSEQMHQRKAVLNLQSDHLYNPVIEFNKARTFYLSFYPVSNDYLEDRDVESANILLRRYGKQLKLVFRSLCKQSKAVRHEEGQERQELDIVRLLSYLRDKNIGITKQEVIQLSKFANRQAEDPLKMNHKAFLILVQQAALFIAFRDSASHFLGPYLETFIKRILQDELIKIDQFEDDQQREWSRQLAADNTISVPNEFVKITKEIQKPVFKFRLFPASHFVCLQVLSQILQKVVGQHLIEPVVLKQTRCIAKRLIRQPKNQDKKALVFIKAQKQKQQAKMDEINKLKNWVVQNQKRRQIMARQSASLMQIRQQKKRVQQDQKASKLQRQKQKKEKEEQLWRKDLEQRKEKLKESKQQKKKMQQQSIKQKLEQQKRQQKQADQNIKKQKQKHDKDIEDAKIQAKNRVLEQNKRREELKINQIKVRKEAAQKLSALKDKSKIEEQARKVMKGFLKQSQFRQLLDEKKDKLMAVYQYYHKHDKFTLEKGTTVQMEFPAFKYFLIDSGIMPNLLSAQEATALYKITSVLQDKIVGLSYPQFELILLQIASKKQALILQRKQTHKNQLQQINALQLQSFKRIVERSCALAPSSPYKKGQKMKKGEQSGKVKQMAVESKQEPYLPPQQEYLQNDY